MKLAEITSQELANAVGSTLFHSLWQATLIGLLLFILLQVLPRKNAQLKYWVSITALCGIVFWTGLTFKDQIVPLMQPETVSEMYALSTWEITANSTPIKSYQLPKLQALTQQAVQWMEPYMSNLVGVWLLGMVFFLVRLQGSMLYLAKMRSSNLTPVPKEWQWKVRELSLQLGITQQVRIMESSLAEIPMVIGNLKPIILIPVGLLTGLAPREVEAVIAHELAHVKRYDYLINIVQTVIESILFFNPAVWWVSRAIRKQREHCCDDIAVKCCGNHLVYAHALTNLGAWSLKPPVLSMGLFKSKNELFQRIKRLVYPHQNRSMKEKFVPAMILILTFGCFTWYSLKVQAQFKPKEITVNQPLVDAVTPVKLNGMVTTNVWADTVPELDEPLPPMEPVPEVIEDIEEMEWLEEPEVFMDPMVEVLEEFEMAVAPDFDFDFNFSMPPVPELAEVMPDVEVWVDAHVDALAEVEANPQVWGLAERQLADTTREKIQEILEAHRADIERAREDQAKAIERAREKLQQTLRQEKPEELTEQEWAEAKEQIRRAERQLERTMEHSQRSLERALKAKENAFLHLEEELARNPHLYYGQLDEDLAREYRDAARQYRDAMRSLRDSERHRNRELRSRLERQHRDRFERHSDQMEHYRESLEIHKEQLKRMKSDMKGLKKELVKDGIIDSMDDNLDISMKKDVIRINGKKLSGAQEEKYRELLDKYLGWDGEGRLRISED